MLVPDWRRFACDVRGALRGVRDAGGRAHAGARQRWGGEEDAQPAAAPRRAAEAVTHAAPRGARGADHRFYKFICDLWDRKDTFNISNPKFFPDKFFTFSS